MVLFITSNVAVLDSPLTVFSKQLNEVFFAPYPE